MNNIAGMIFMEKVIQITISEVLVKGRIVYRSASDISVEITDPFINIKTGLHIPHFARSHASFKGSYGELTARHLLVNLYQVLQLINRKEDFFKASLNDYKKKLNIDGKLSYEQMDFFFDKIIKLQLSRDLQEQIAAIFEGDIIYVK
jgi:hypothetical protein